MENIDLAVFAYASLFACQAIVQRQLFSQLTLNRIFSGWVTRERQMNQSEHDVILRGTATAFVNARRLRTASNQLIDERRFRLLQINLHVDRVLIGEQ